jgi:hypothetical protein
LARDSAGLIELRREIAKRPGARHNRRYRDRVMALIRRY